MSLSVYKLDGAPGEGAICVLSRGEYQIGRGPLLKCFDKRTSTHQALIKVEAETSSITSTHKIPCFYQSAVGKTIIILPEYSPVNIQTGDKFGLLADKCWFRFHFESKEGGTAMQSETETSSQNEGRLKRPCELGPEVETERKQPKLADGEACIDEKSDMSASEGDSLRSRLVESSSVRDLEGNNEVTKKPENYRNGSSKSVREDGTSKVKVDVEDDKLESDGNDEASAKINTVGSHGNHDPHVSDSEVKNVSPVQDSLESNVLNGAVDGEINGGIANDNGCHSEARHECPSNNSEPEDVASVAASSSANAQESQPVDKKEKLAHSEHEEEEEEEEEEENENDEREGEEDVGPQPDGNASASTKREKCWYGSGCYRKNPNHRSQFSHPGDADYVPDPNDDRPTCSYGANCYRRNKDHRKEYKHPGKPAANQKRKRKRVTKATTATTQNDESSEDDYDYDDPFLDDGSEDEYEEESWSECDSDEDWENSQNASDDEDTVKNLLKEAKRFTRTKK